MDIDDYMDLAKGNNSIKSDRKLSEALDLKSAATNQWRTRRVWPSDATMVKLAKLAGVDPAEALIDLNIWRSHGEAISIYTRMKKTVSAAIILLVVAIAGQAATPSTATASPDIVSSENASTIYYGKYKAWFLNAIFRIYNAICAGILNAHLQRKNRQC